MTIVEIPRAVTGGVDTHLDTNVAATLDDVGGLLGVEEFATDAGGHRRLLSSQETFGTVGVEGTGSCEGNTASILLVAAGDNPGRLCLAAEARERRVWPTISG